MPPPSCPNCRRSLARCSCIPAWFWHEHPVQLAVLAQRPTDLVRLLRQKLDLRQAEVARLTGVPQSTVSRVEHGWGLSTESGDRGWKNLDPPSAPPELLGPEPASTDSSAVIARPSGLRPHMLEAFAEGDVQIDFAGFSGETLHSVLQDPLDRVREQSLRPTSLRLRMLVPDLTRPQGLPSRADSREDDPDLRERAQTIIARSLQSLRDVVYELQHRQLLEHASVQARIYDGIPQIKLYSLNRRSVFTGYYPVAPNTVMLHGEPVAIHDLMGRDTVLFHYRATGEPNDVGTMQVEQAHLWFESLWRYAWEAA